MTTRREPPPIEDHNPPTPPQRQPPPETPSREIARPVAHPPPRGETTDPNLLASLLASGAAPGTSATTPGRGSIFEDLVKLRSRRVDPFKDFVGDGTRVLRWVQDTIAHEAALTGAKQQEIMSDVLLGRRRLSPDLLDAHFRERYGYDRPREEPEEGQPDA